MRKCSDTGESFPFDRVLLEFTGGKPIREIVASDLPKTLERRADMVLLVDPGELHHLEFQSTDFSGLPYRQGVDCFLLAERYKKRRIFQHVIYFGEARMRMRDRLNVGAGSIEYRMADIREYDWKDVASGGAAADLVLAVLAKGGRVNLRLILERIYELHPEERNRALAQVALLAGLRRVSETVKMELKRMGLYATIEHNVILRDLYEQAKAEGMEKGVDTATRTDLKTILEVKFGRIPDWAMSKIDQAPLADLQRWVRQSVTARSLQTLLGRK